MLNINLLFQYDFVLKWKDIVVLEFNVNQESLQVVNSEYLPMNIQGKVESFDMIKKFCSDRILMYNRDYSKEILTSCGIDDSSPLAICFVCMALSFRDNYWICKKRDVMTWSEVSLYTNLFSNEIAYTSLTGETKHINLDDTLFTGELTNKGTRPKCFLRNDGKLYLCKNEIKSEIKAEILSYYVAEAIGIGCSFYTNNKVFEKDCSVCQILTNEHHELIPYRDILSYAGNTDGTVDAYDFIMNVDAYNFCLMQIFDYLTLNTDRNRDNFGLLRFDYNLVSLYPLFDHDSCFKGKSTNGIYFPSGLTFRKTLEKIQKLNVYHNIDIQKIKKNINSSHLADLFKKYKCFNWYESMLVRLDDI